MHESMLNHLARFLISVVALQEVNLFKMDASDIKLLIFTVQAPLLSSSLSSSVQASPVLFLGAVLPAGRRLALARRRLEKAFRFF